MRFALVRLGLVALAVSSLPEASGGAPLASVADPAPPAEPSPGDTLSALLDRVAEAYGGRERVLAVAGYRARGKTLSLADGMNGTVRLWVDLEGAVRAETKYPHHTDVRILSGRAAWHGGKRRQKPAKDGVPGELRLLYGRLAAPWELLRASPGALESADGPVDGLTRIRVRDEAGELTLVCDVDTQTGRILRTHPAVASSGEGAADKGGSDRFTEASDFRMVEGVLFPFRMTTIVGDEVTSETTLDRITLEEDFRSETFLPTGTASDL